MAKGISLHLGLNSLSPDHYAGWNGSLNACEYDAEDMYDIAINQGYAVHDILLSPKATKSNFKKAINDISKKLLSGDTFLLTYSGHGDQRKDKNGDEKDGLDETWCLYDEQIIDDEIYQLLSGFKAGVRIVIVSDSCHSETIFRVNPYGLINNDIANAKVRCVPKHVSGKVYRQNRVIYEKILKNKALAKIKEKVKATIRTISACQDNQTALDMSSNGLFTGVLLDIWDNGYFKGNYYSFVREIVKNMPSDQTPKHSIIGPVIPDFNKQKPFEI